MVLAGATSAWTCAGQVIPQVIFEPASRSICGGLVAIRTMSASTYCGGARRLGLSGADSIGAACRRH